MNINPLYMFNLLAIFIPILAGCSSGPSDEEIVSKNAVFIAQIKSMKNPWEARNKIIERENEVYDAYRNDHCSLQAHCQAWPPNQSLQAEASRYEELALQQMNTGALLHIFSDDTAKGNRQDIANKILEMAKTSNDSSILAIAGDIERKGVYTIRDDSLAVAYYARSWALGNLQAANSAAMTFYSVNDIQNSYLWSLRCMGDCSRNFEVELGTLESKFSPAAAKQLQKAASDPTTIELHD